MNPADATATHYPIRAVSKMTGIGIDTLRAWERRYGAVAPRREGRGRVYTDVDVERLRLLNDALAAGHSIGGVAHLDDGALRRIVATKPQPAAPEPAATLSAIGRSRDRLEAALLELDTAAVDQECWRLAAVMPPLELVRDVLMPTLRQVGDVWHTRTGGIAQEHVISGTIRHLLGSFLRLYTRPASVTRLLFATPAGDRHEIGILGAAMLAANQGLGISYVGPDLPAREMLEAVKASRAQVLVLAVTLTDKPRPREQELAAIVKGLPADVELWVGGAAAPLFRKTLGRRALLLPDLDAYQQQLQRIATRA